MGSWYELLMVVNILESVAGRAILSIFFSSSSSFFIYLLRMGLPPYIGGNEQRFR